MNFDGESLRIARRIKGITMEEAGAELGFTRRAVGSWERGERQPHPVHRRIIEEATARWLREVAGL